MDRDGSQKREGEDECCKGFFHEAQFEWFEIARNRDSRLVPHLEPRKVRSAYSQLRTQKCVPIHASP